MRVLLDLNVLIDVGARWREYPDSAACFEALVAGSDEGCLPGCGYTTLFYVMRQTIGSDRALSVLQHFDQSLHLVAFDKRVAELAHRLDFSDFEDACVAATAVTGGCELIVSRNTSDFARSPIRAVPPEQWLPRQ